MIGILGGTFDPIHFGHLRTALEVQQALDLDEVRLIPLRDPPHRSPPGAPAGQRLAMVQAAAADESFFRVDDRELRRSGKSYTLETLQSLRIELGETPLCLIMGSDAFRGFPAWHEPGQILETAHLVIMRRPGEDPPSPYPDRVVPTPETLRSHKCGSILFLEVSQLEISSTRIRRLVSEGRSPRYLLPDPVLDIIREHKLYLHQAPAQ